MSWGKLLQLQLGTTQENNVFIMAPTVGEGINTAGRKTILALTPPMRRSQVKVLSRMMVLADQSVSGG